MSHSQKYLIDYSNIDQQLVKQKNFIDTENLIKFYNNPQCGIPLTLPVNLKEFRYSANDDFKFKIDPKQFSKFIFSDPNYEYSFSKKYFKYGNLFTSEATPLKKYEKYFSRILSFM